VTLQQYGGNSPLTGVKGNDDFFAVVEVLEDWGVDQCFFRLGERMVAALYW